MIWHEIERDLLMIDDSWEAEVLNQSLVDEGTFAAWKRSRNG